MVAEILFQHGWAYSCATWSHLLDALSRRLDWRFVAQLPDRGYFNDGVNSRSFDSGTKPKIIVAHSFGLHLIPARLLNSADSLILLGCFLSFNPAGEREAKLTRRMTSKMIERFKTEPEAVLREFYSNSGDESSASIDVSSADRDLLLKDLGLLADSQFDCKNIERIKNITIFQSRDDRIVPVEHAMTLKERLPHARLRILNSGAHVPHLLRINDVAEAIALDVCSGDIVPARGMVPVGGGMR